MKPEQMIPFMLTATTSALSVSVRAAAKKTLEEGESAPKPFLGWFDGEPTAFDAADFVLLCALALFVIGIAGLRDSNN